MNCSISVLCAIRNLYLEAQKNMKIVTQSARCYITNFFLSLLLNGTRNFTFDAMHDVNAQLTNEPTKPTHALVCD